MVNFATNRSSPSSFSQLSATLQSDITAFEAEAEEVTTPLLERYLSLRHAVQRESTVEKVDCCSSIRIVSLFAAGLNLYDQARPVRRDLAAGPWRLDKDRFYRYFDEQTYSSLKFLRSLRELARHEHNFDVALDLIKAESASRRVRSRPMKGASLATKWQPRDVERVCTAYKDETATSRSARFQILSNTLWIQSIQRQWKSKTVLTMTPMQPVKTMHEHLPTCLD